METTQVLISSPIGVLAVLCIVAAFFFLLALLGYALGNYLAPLTGHLARIAAGQ